MSNEEDEFVAYRKIAKLESLQEMASCRVTLAIWNSYVSRLKYASPILDYSKRVSFFFKSFEEDANEFIEDLALPPRIEATLKTSLKNISWEIDCCCMQFAITMSGHPDYQQDIRFDPNWLFLLPNGKIDYRKSAKKVISDEESGLSVAQKFFLTWHCCLEDEARTIMSNENVDAVVDSFMGQGWRYVQNYHVVRWWLDYLRNESEPYALQGEEIRTTSWPLAGIMTEYEMDFTSEVRINQYWLRLTKDDRVVGVYNMIVNRSAWFRKKWPIIESLISSMSAEQQRSLLSMRNTAVKIVRASWKYSSSWDCMLWAWNYCRGFASGTEFNKILSRDRPPDDEEDDEYEARGPFLFSNAAKLWDAASAYQKDFFMSRNGEEWGLLDTPKYRDRYFYVDLKPVSYDLLEKYVTAITSPERRAAFILARSVDLARGTIDPDDLKHIFHSLLPCPNDQLQFKIHISNSSLVEKHFAKHWRCGNCDALNANLKFYFDDDEDAVRAYLQKLSKLLKENDWEDDGSYKCAITDADKWIKFSQLIDAAFAHDPAEALIIKKRSVSQFLLSNYNKWYRGRYIVDCRGKFFHHSEIVLNQAFKTVETVYHDAEEIKHLKSQFLVDKKSLGNICCYDVYIHKVIEWCCDDNEEAIVLFKKTFESQDDIFDLVFFQLNKAYVTEAKGIKESLLARLDKYLLWYSADEQQVNEYKSSRLVESDKLSIFSTIRRAKDEISLQILLEWFCNGDDEKILEFMLKKTKY